MATKQLAILRRYLKTYPEASVFLDNPDNPRATLATDGYSVLWLPFSPSVEVTPNPLEYRSALELIQRLQPTDPRISLYPRGWRVLEAVAQDDPALSLAWTLAGDLVVANSVAGAVTTVLVAKFTRPPWKYLRTTSAVVRGTRVAQGIRILKPSVLAIGDGVVRLSDNTGQLSYLVAH